jgi:xanthine/CO dehydrogenase XdhC/CoxF family maturation factor
MADILGWKTTVIDGRPRLANQSRFMSSCRVFLADPKQALAHIPSGGRTAVLLMTHNYRYDQQVLRELLQQDIAYIGCLGPRKKLARMLAELEAGGPKVDDTRLQAIHGPAGLDIGAETPEEIALSILAEIKAFLAARPGEPLRGLESTIHSGADTLVERIILPVVPAQNQAIE